MRARATLGLLAQVALALLLLFFGWGFDDWRGFMSHPARAGLLAIALVGILVVLVWRLDLQIFRRGQRPVGRQRLGLAGLLGVALFLVWFLPYADRRGVFTFTQAEALRYVGVLLYAAGSVIVLFALRALGRQYSAYVTVQDGHQLVQSGIYSVIRHPIYLRALLVSVGLPLVFRSWLVLVLLPLVGVFVAFRIRQEEKLLAEQFGEQFEAYRRRTWRLVPYLY